MLLVPPSTLVSGHDNVLDDFRILRDSALGTPGVELVESPEDADWILFVGCRERFQRDVRRHPVYRRNPSRCFVYDSSDHVIPLLPGIYPSIPRRRYRPNWTRSGCYLRWIDSPFIEATPISTDTSWLFSFVGAASTHPLRREVLALQHRRGYLEDTSGAPARGAGQSPASYESYKQHYAEVIASSKFVLCPRGAGPGSMRIFEAMKAGRVPVVISNEWVAPVGARWAEFSLRVPEGKITAEILQLMESSEPLAAEMGRTARQQWEEHFSPVSVFAAFCASIEDLPRRTPATDAVERYRSRLQVVGWLVNRIVARGASWTGTSRTE